MTQRAHRHREELPPATEARRAQSPLGKRLREIRKRIVASGVRLLDWDEVERELRQRRGGVS